MSETSLRSNRHREKRAAILDAAEVEFGTRGFTKTALTEVAMAAGVSRPLLYRHFSDKEELFDAVVTRINHQWESVLATEAARNTPSTAHTVRLVLTASIEFAERRKFLNQLLSPDSRHILDTFSDATIKGRGMLRRLIRKVLQQGIQRGDVRNDLDVDDLAHVISEVFLAYADHIIIGDDEVLSTRRVEAILETLFHGFVANR